MAREKQKISEYKGRFHRTIGKALNERGYVMPRKFLLGTDRAAAEIANRLLEKLWEEVEAEHWDAVRFKQELGGRLGDSDRISAEIDHRRLRQLDHGPIWRGESLLIAEAIRRGAREVTVRVGSDLDPSPYVERIAALRRTYSVIAFVPESLRWHAQGQATLATEARELADQARDLAEVAQTSCRF